MPLAKLPSVLLPRLRVSMISAMLLSGTALAAAAPAAFVLVGATRAEQTVSMAFSLPSRDPAGAAAFVADVTRLGDPLYRHYLTPEEYAARFGASQADYDALVAWAKTAGLAVGERYAARTVLPVSGSAAVLARLMGVTFNDYRDANGRIFHVADNAGFLPAEVADKVDGVIGLSGVPGFVPYVRRLPAGVKPTASGTGPNGGFLAADLRAIYAVQPQPFSSQTQTLAVFEQGGFDPEDVATYLKRNKLPAVPVRARTVNNYGGGINDPGVELEAVLDIDMLIGINPAARQVLVYENGQDSFPQALLECLSAMASDNAAKSISISYGQDEALQGQSAITAENTVLTQMAAQGQAVFASSGDDGAYGDQSAGPLNVSDPASQPYVTGVGGTTLFSANDTYQAEKTWDDFGNVFTNLGASGGGISTAWPIPSYQAMAQPSSNGGSDTQRNVPDVAAVGDPLTGVDIYSRLNGGWVTVGGTSVSAPIWAGFYSLVNAASEGLGFGVVGFANPPIYYLGSGANAQGVLSPDFNDVIIGRNGYAPFGTDGFYAGIGYDDTTGFGSLNANALIDLSILPTAAETDQPPAPYDLVVDAASTKATITWKGAKGDKGYIVYLATYASSNEVSATLQGGMSATVTGLAPNTYYEFVIVSITAGGRAVSIPDIFSTSQKAS